MTGGEFDRPRYPRKHQSNVTCRKAELSDDGTSAFRAKGQFSEVNYICTA